MKRGTQGEKKDLRDEVEEEGIKEENKRIRKWDEEDEMGNLQDPYNELLGTRTFKRGVLS